MSEWKYRLFFALVASLSAMFVMPGVAAAATFTVTNNSDSGAGSLRQALADAEANNNTPTLDTIDFDLPLTGGDTITLQTWLPDLMERVSIDGCSETPDHAGPCIGLRKNDGLAEGIAFGANSSSVRGIAFTNIYTGVKTLAGTQLATIKNNWFGLMLDGTPEPVGVAIKLMGNTATVGGPNGATGTSPADRNVISTAQVADFNTAGIWIFSDGSEPSGDDNQVVGNYFGTSSTGNSMFATQDKRDIVIQSDSASAPAEDNVIGGTANPAEIASTQCDGPCNVVGGSLAHGVMLVGATSGTVIAGNYIGVGADGSSDVGNAMNGIVGSGGSPTNHVTGTLIGGIAADAVGAENLISNNGENGIGFPYQGDDQNAIGRNRGSGNGGYFIDLGPTGPGNVSGSNAAIEAPVIDSATSIEITGSADPNAIVRVFKKNDMTFGELAGFVGQTTADAFGNWSFPPSAPMPDDGQRITATQTGMSLFGMTGSSELATTKVFDVIELPAVTLTAPADGAVFALGTTVNADYSCGVDAATTLSSCTGSVADGAAIDTASAGAKTFAVTATDALGQSTTVTHNYTVAAPPVPVAPAAPAAPADTRATAKIRLKKSGKTKVKGKNVSFAAVLSLKPPKGLAIKTACKSAKLTATTKPKGVRKAIKARASLKAKGKNCQAIFEFKLPKKFKGKKVKIAVAFSGNTVFKEADKTVSYKIR